MVLVARAVVVAWFAFSVLSANLRWFPTPWLIKTRQPPPLPRTLSLRLPCHPTPFGEIAPNICSLVTPSFVPPSVSHVPNQIAIRVSAVYRMNFFVEKSPENKPLLHLLFIHFICEISKLIFLLLIACPMTYLKKENSIQIEKLRVILLLEADFNAVLKLSLILDWYQI